VPPPSPVYGRAPCIGLFAGVDVNANGVDAKEPHDACFLLVPS
jgi:hypothetical protein